MGLLEEYVLVTILNTIAELKNLIVAAISVCTIRRVTAKIDDLCGGQRRLSESYYIIININGIPL